MTSPRYITTAEAAAILGISRQAIEQAVGKGKIKAKIQDNPIRRMVLRPSVMRYKKNRDKQRSGKGMGK